MRILFFSYLFAVLAILAGVTAHALSVAVSAKSVVIAAVALLISLFLLVLAKRSRDWCWAIMISGTVCYLAAYAAQEYILNIAQKTYTVTPDHTDWDTRSIFEVVAALKSNDVRAFAVLDLSIPLRNHADAKSLYARHFNTLGYQFAADTIGKALKRLKPHTESQK